MKSKEKEYRDKLVMKLKKKVVGDLDTQKTMIKKTRNEGDPTPSRECLGLDMVVELRVQFSREIF